MDVFIPVPQVLWFSLSLATILFPTLVMKDGCLYLLGLYWLYQELPGLAKDLSFWEKDNLMFFPHPHLAEQRLEEIKFWKQQLDDKLDQIVKETEVLLTFTTRLKKALESCKEPLFIVQECLLNR